MVERGARLGVVKLQPRHALVVPVVIRDVKASAQTVAARTAPDVVVRVAILLVEQGALTVLLVLVDVVQRANHVLMDALVHAVETAVDVLDAALDALARVTVVTQVVRVRVHLALEIALVDVTELVPVVLVVAMIRATTGAMELVRLLVEEKTVSASHPMEATDVRPRRVQFLAKQG
jgi:hypothetical protein